MSRKKKTVGFLAVAVASASAALVGSAIVRDAQLARARDTVEEARKQLADADVGQMGAVYRNVGRVMEPSVVNISVKKNATGGARTLPFDDEMLRRMFPDRDRDGEPDLPPGLGGGPGGLDEDRYPSLGTGSGVILETVGGSGFILTNNHVAGGASEIEITLADGRVIKNGKLLGTDSKTDLAVIEIKADRLIPARWGDSDGLQRGDIVMAFGSPFGYVGSMTHGIVSALNRQAGILADRQGYENFIQVDCPINPGNSGGPLTNLKGEVVGINTAIASRNGGFQGIGFAIPSNQAKFVYQQLKSSGKVTRGWLGVSISDVSRDPEKAASFGYKGEKGVLVEQTFPGTPAHGKLEPGDIVTDVGGKPVQSVQELRNAVAATKPDVELTMRVFRDGKFTEVPVKVGEQPDDLSAVARGGAETPRRPGARERVDANEIGVHLTDISPATKQRLSAQGIDADGGAVVAAVTPRSPAARAGLQIGDVITRVGDAEVANARETNDALAKAGEQDVRLYVTNAAGSRFVLVKQGEK